MLYLPNSQGHYCQGWIRRRTAGKNAAIGNEQVRDVMTLPPPIGHTVAGFGTHTSHAHVVAATTVAESCGDAGNVREFLYDEWTDTYRETGQVDPVSGGIVEDADILNLTGHRAVRGASYDGSVVNLRTRWRDSHVVSNAIECVGCRRAYPN